MKAHVLGSVIALVALAACSRPANHIPEGVAQVFDLRTGDELNVKTATKADGFYGTIQEEGQFISFVRYNPDAFQTMVVNAEAEHADSTSALCLGCDAFAGINGSYFNMQELTAVTFIKDDGFVTSVTPERLATRVNGALILNPEEVRIDACDTTETFELDWEAIAAGPLLLDDGQLAADNQDTSFNDTRHPRSLIGKDADGGVWFVVVDGRFPGEAEGMTIEELTALAGRLGLVEALNLDGGGSSTLWVLPVGVLNHPCDNGQFDHVGQRIVPNVIVAR
jgi:exopolysaccharide biosynthesis protein